MSKVSRRERPPRQTDVANKPEWPTMALSRYPAGNRCHTRYYLELLLSSDCGCRNGILPRTGVTASIKLVAPVERAYEGLRWKRPVCSGLRTFDAVCVSELERGSCFVRNRRACAGFW